MNKYIFKFSKAETVKYVSHLDTLRVFERAIRRAELPMSYSQGFNPHPLITFAHPLGVGISSQCELVEITFDRELTQEELTLFAQKMPDGFDLLANRENEKKSPFAALESSLYQIDLYGTVPENGLLDFLERKEIPVKKWTKRGEKEIDIRNMIHKLSGTKTPYGMRIQAELQTGQPSLKPELMLQAMKQYIEGIEIEKNEIKRLNMLDKQGKAVWE